MEGGREGERKELMWMGVCLPLRECAVSAGFQVMRIISEPAAVCLAHGEG